MEIKVTIGFEKQAAEILNKLVEALGQKAITVRKLKQLLKRRNLN